jgi:uncharacterized protein (TIGR02391 family)
MFELLQEFPDPTPLLNLQPEELGTKMLFFMKKREQSPLKHQMVGSGSNFMLSAFENELWGISPLPQPTKYPKSKAGEINAALSEAWNWLEREALLTPDSGINGLNGWRQLSRRAKEMNISSDFVNANAARLFPQKQLHPLIASKTYPSFLHGKYDTAIFEAFREIEIAVRKAGGFKHENYGTELMRDAFRPSEKKGQAVAPGPLTDTLLPIAEQEAMANLFSGAIGLYKNPQSHRQVPTNAEEAIEVIVFASQLLLIVDRLKAP